jgi:transposase InsO family protein
MPTLARWRMSKEEMVCAADHPHRPILRHVCTGQASLWRIPEAEQVPHGEGAGVSARRSLRAGQPATPGERRYILLLVDDATRYMWVAFLAAKSEATGAIRRIQEAAEECGRKLRVLRIDNGREFTAAEFTAYYVDEGVKRHFSMVERRNQTVVVMAHALLIEIISCPGPVDRLYVI